MTAAPLDPVTKAVYHYAPVGSPATSYTLSATLEDANNQALDQDALTGNDPQYDVAP